MKEMSSKLISHDLWLVALLHCCNSMHIFNRLLYNLCKNVCSCLESIFLDKTSSDSYITNSFFLQTIIINFDQLKAPSRKPAVCCCFVVAAAYTNRGGRPGLPNCGFKTLQQYFCQVKRLLRKQNTLLFLFSFCDVS